MPTPGVIESGPRGRAILHEHLRRALAEAISVVVRQEPRTLRKLSRQIPADLLADFVASSFVLVLNWWLDRGMPQPPKEINDTFYKLISPALVAVWE